MKVTLNQTRFILTILMLFILAWLASSLIWKTLSPTKPLLVLPEINHKSSSIEPLNHVFNIDLFGTNKTVTREVKPKAANIKKSKLKLKLLGTLAIPGAGVAIIEKSGKSFSFTLDETIQQGVVLKEVHTNHIVIERNGVMEKLEMATNASVFVEQTATSKKLSSEQQSQLNSVKKNAIKNPTSILRYVRFRTINHQGKPQGIQVWPRKEKAIFNALGFKSGDIIQVINNYTVAEVMKSPKLWKEMMTQPLLDLVILRKEQTQNLSVQLDG